MYVVGTIVFRTTGTFRCPNEVCSQTSVLRVHFTSEFMCPIGWDYFLRFSGHKKSSGSRFDINRWSKLTEFRMRGPFQVHYLKTFSTDKAILCRWVLLEGSAVARLVKARKPFIEVEISSPRSQQPTSRTYTKTLINICQHNYFIIQGYMFRPFKLSSLGLLIDWVNRCCVHVGIPMCLHR